MFDRSSMEFRPKVTAALDVLYQLRFGTAYDYLFDRPLRVVVVQDLRGMTTNAEPLVICRGSYFGPTLTYPHPRSYLKDFELDWCNWVEEKYWDIAKSDLFRLDMRSNWYVNLVSGHENWGYYKKKGIVSVGVSQVPKAPVRVNSLSIGWSDFGGEGGYRGPTFAILLPRQ